MKCRCGPDSATGEDIDINPECLIHGIGITFRELNQSLNDEWSCSRCGAMTDNPEKHTKWHEKLNEILGMGNVLTAFLPEDERLV